MKVTRCLFLALLLLVLAACASTSDATTPNALHVTRIGPGKVRSLDRMINDSAAVQKLYTAAHALPAVTPGLHICPSYHYDGTVYHLDFLHAATSLQQMDLDVGGCHWLHLSKTDVRQGDYGNFFPQFLQTIGGS
ncbi:MAG: hypothetical protein M3Z08_12385 [Chloroflexota bacterium]|nr:hypothetical protein [Chloroflexota bacterium]